MTATRRVTVVALLTAFVAGAMGVTTSPPVDAATTVDEVGLEVLSSRPDTVTGGTALVQVHLPEDLPGTAVRVLLDGADVTSAFRPYGSGLRGLVDGVQEGDNELVVVAADPVAAACDDGLPASGFVDVGPTHAAAVACLVAHGLTQGRTDTRFGTSEDLRRRQLALLLLRALELVPDLALPEPVDGVFSDVPADQFATAIGTLAAFDPPVLRGDTDGRFRPRDPVRRGQLASVLVRLHDDLVVRFPGLPPLPSAGDSAFADVAPDDTHGEAILRLAAAELIRGFDDGTFRANRAVTRGQLASMLVNVLDGWAQAGLFPTLGAHAASMSDGEELATLTLVGHPRVGPVFSGPHQQPFICRTAEWGLGEPLDEYCSAETQVVWRYRTTGGSFAVLADPTERPADLATTVVDGQEVDYIVRLERGTINRAIYEIAMLADPDGALPDPWTGSPRWNDRLVYTFGGGCGPGYHQGGPGSLLGGGVLDHTMLSQGYAVATSTLNVNQNNCNDVVSAETAAMVKEHFIESFGPPRHTIGWGGSGGAIQQHLIAQNYPGILDGIIPMMSYPDNLSIAPGVVDCRLLDGYFQASGQTWTPAERTAISGFATWQTCVFWNLAFSSNIVPTVGCDPSVPPAMIYHPVDNPTGVRCTLPDHSVNLLGRDPVTGFARNPFDNQGVQYGLAALEAGVLSVERFLDLNEGIGGYDADGNRVPGRSVGDDEALRIVQETGRVTLGGLGLAEVPILDVRPYTDPLGDIHDRYRSFTVRHRLIETTGHADNHVMWTGSPAVMTGAVAALALERMDAWLTAIGADTRDLPLAQRVVDNRPADVVDACWTAAGDRIDEPAVFGGEGECNTLFPTHDSPRIVAGAAAPLDDVAACALRTPEPEDYEVTFTPDEWDRLLDVFPDGVCDWEAGNRIQAEPRGTWLSFQDGPG